MPMDTSKGIRLVFVGKHIAPRITATNWLYKKRGFKKMYLEDGVVKLIRDMYTYKLHKRVPWEKKYRIYNILYKEDPNIHIDYLLRKLETTTRDVIVPDCRYLNELQKLIDHNFVVIRLNTTPKGGIRLAGMEEAAAGSLKLQEYFARIDAFPVDYSILADDIWKTREMLDIIIEKERAKRAG